MSNPIQVENGIPMPCPKNRGCADALRSLEAGQSILVPITSRGSIGYASKNTGFKFTTQIVGDKIRIWRKP